MPNHKKQGYFSTLCIRNIIAIRKTAECNRVTKDAVKLFKKDLEEYADKMLNNIHLIMKHSNKKTMTVEHIKSAKEFKM